MPVNFIESFDLLNGPHRIVDLQKVARPIKPDKFRGREKLMIPGTERSRHDLVLPSGFR